MSEKDLSEMKNIIKQTVNGYKRILQISKPFDKRNPKPGKNYGIGSLRLNFYIIKDNKAVDFTCSTGTYLPHIETPPSSMGYDVGYHSPTPMYKDHNAGPCNLLDCDCYSDGSSLQAQEWFVIFLEQGSDKIWEMLEEYWNDRFNNEN